MAGTTGISDKKYYSAVNFFDKRPDIESGMIDIQNEMGGEYDMPDILGGRYVPLQNGQGSYHNFVNDALFVVGDTTGATIVGSGSARTLTGVTLTAATSGFARVNDLVTLPNGKQAIVTALSTASSQDTLTLKNVESGNLTLVAGNLITIGSNAQYEQSSAQTSRRYLPTKYYNKWQIFKEQDSITDVESVAKKEITAPNGDNYVMYINHVRKLQLLKMQIAYQYIAGKMSEGSFEDASPTIVDGNGHTFQTTRGLDDYIGSYGQAPTLTSAGTITNTDLRNLVKKLAAARCPKQFMVWMNTESKTIFDEYLKGLGSSAVTRGYLTLDGNKLNMQSDGFQYGGFDFDLGVLPVLDHAQLFNYTGSAGLQKNAYFVPKDSVKTEGGGGVVPRIRVRYLPKSPVQGGTAKGIITEINTGLLAPVPTGTDMSFNTTWISYQGLECLGVQHFAKMQIAS